MSLNFNSFIFVNNFFSLSNFFFFGVFLVTTSFFLVNVGGGLVKNKLLNHILKKTYLFLLSIGLIIYILNYLFLTYFFNTIVCISTLSVVLIILVFLTGIVSYAYLSEKGLYKNNFFYIYFYIFILTTIGLVTTSNLVIMFLYFEFIFLPSLIFVYKFGYAKKTIKTISFLFSWTFAGSVCVLISLLYLVSVYQLTNIVQLKYISFSSMEQKLNLLLIFLGFGIKIPVWPWYYWLTKVHVEAPTGFSIFLSGFLVKTAFYCFAQLFYLFQNVTITPLILSVVFIGVLDSSVRMWSATDIKRLIALATVQEMNLIALLFLLTSNINNMFVGLFLFVHGCLSGFFFFLIDQVQKRTHTRNLTAISGLNIYMPTLTSLVWISLLIFRGFPLFIKFLIEWEILILLIQNFFIFGFLAFFVFSFAGVLGFARIWFICLYGQPQGVTLRYDLAQKDVVFGLFFSAILFLLNFFFFLCGWSFI